MRGFLNRISRKKSKTELSNKEKLRNMQQFLESFIVNCKTDCRLEKDVFSVMKIITDKITIDAMYSVVTTMDSCYPQGKTFSFESPIRIEGTYDLQKGRDLKRLTWLENTNVIRRNFVEVFDPQYEIDLGKDPVITLPWSFSRLSGTMAYINEDVNPWIQDETNHMADLYLPIGVCVVYNGNHSTAAGIIKGSGRLALGRNTTKDAGLRKVFDMSPLYDHMYFDGDDFIEKQSGKVIGKCEEFYVGCLFELGRIIKKYDINFKDVVESGKSK
jgi:hypothetical protein